jgi:hypothetical protein
LIVILIPFLEEVFKPLALWFFIKHEWLPSEGFTAGLICGASFALVESTLYLTSIPAETWAVTLLGRIGTGLLHTLTAGLTGWALVSSWRDGNYKRIGWIYLGSVLIHGSWNFFALVYGLATDLEILKTPAMAGLVSISPWVLGALFSGMLTLLLVMNLKIQTTLVPPAIPSAPAETIG